jgi:subtilisin family serine protease
MNEITLFLKRGIKVFLLLVFVFAETSLFGQGGGYNYFYRVYFRDKPANSIDDYSLSDLLSEKAINRREKSGIAVLNYQDVPVYSGYLNQISALGFTLHCTSKWLNTALFKTQTFIDPDTLLGLAFVADVKVVKDPVVKSLYKDKLDFTIEQAIAPSFDRPITMLNGYPLHLSGFDGSGILIAVLDGGFFNADKISSLNNLRNRNGIIGTFDFVDNDQFVYDYHTHGTAVLSVLAGQIEGIIQGTAPEADFLLLRTEDVSSEFSSEEDLWAAGAEFADSAGADIISSSLGYYYFDNSILNYKYSDLDGNTAFVTRAADIAASKGILVVNSAGNERDNTWIHIIAPADGDSVVAVGAVDDNEIISYFSSAGPSFDRRIKPDISAMGVNVTVQTSVSLVGIASGTSFSCPVLSGMTACLMEAVPDATNYEIIEALHSSADRFNMPDSLYGYGIPDMVKTLQKLQENHLVIPDNESVIAPNPTTGSFDVIFSEAPGYVTVEIFSSSGVTFYKNDLGEYAGRKLRITALFNKDPGLYFIRLTTGIGTFVHKIVKLSY